MHYTHPPLWLLVVFILASASLGTIAESPQQQAGEAVAVERAAQELRAKIANLEDSLRSANERRGSRMPESMRAWTYKHIGDLQIELCWLYASTSAPSQQDEAARAAVTAYSEALLAGGLTARSLAGLGEAAFCLEEWETAVSRFKEALREEPSIDRVQTLLGVAYLRLGRNHNARGALQAAVESDPDDATARVHLATALIRLGLPEEAREQCLILRELGKGALCHMIEKETEELPPSGAAAEP